MNLFEAIVSRTSGRKFDKKDVDDNLIGVLLYMAGQAPSASNTQEWKFIVVRDAKQKDKLAVAALHQNFIKTAPVVIVVCSDLEKIKLRHGERGERMYALQDSGAAIQNILLSCTALGLASCWIGSFDEEEVKGILELPENFRPVAMLPIAYPAETPQKPKRLAFENFTWAEKYGRKYELTVATQPEREDTRLVGPLGSYLEDLFEKIRRERSGKKEAGVKKEKKIVKFEDFLKKFKKQRPEE